MRYPIWLAIFNQSYLDSLSESESSKTRLENIKKVSLLRGYANSAIKICANKFKDYNVPKYFKPIYNTTNTNAFVAGEKNLDLIDCKSSEKFCEEYKTSGFVDYNSMVNAIVDYIRSKVSGTVGSTIYRDGGTIWYKE